MDKVYSSVAELQDDLRKEYKIGEYAEEEDTQKNANDADEQQDNDEHLEDDVNEQSEQDEQDEQSDDDDSADEQDDTQVETVTKKPSKEDKQHHAFEELRNKNKEIESKVEEYKSKITEFDELALMLGFKDTSELIKQTREQVLQKEAKEKGVDPAYLRRVQELESDQKKTNQEVRKLKEERQALDVRLAIDTFATTEKLSEQEKMTLIQNLDDDGYTIQDLAGQKNLTRVLKGYAADIIAERKVQKAIKDKSEMVEKKFENQTENQKNEIDIDALVKSQLEKYRKSMLGQ